MLEECDTTDGDDTCESVSAFLVHNLAKSYLGYDETAAQIVGLIQAAQAQLRQAEAVRIPGSTWDSIIEDDAGRTVQQWMAIAGDEARVDGSGSPHPNGPRRHRGFVGFDLSGIPAGSRIVSARLQLRLHVPPAVPPSTTPHPTPRSPTLAASSQIMSRGEARLKRRTTTARPLCSREHWSPPTSSTAAIPSFPSAPATSAAQCKRI